MKFLLLEDYKNWTDSQIYNYFNYRDRITEMVENEFFGSSESKELFNNVLSKLIDFVDEKTLHSFCLDYEIGYYDDEEDFCVYDDIDDIKSFISDLGGYDETISNIIRYISIDQAQAFYYYCGMDGINKQDFADELDEDEISKETYDKIMDRFEKDKKTSFNYIKNKTSSTTKKINITEKQVQDIAEEVAEDFYETSETDATRGFILRDGFIVSNNSILNNWKNDRHGNADKVLLSAVATKLGVSEKDVTDAVGMLYSYDANGSNGSLLADCLGWIRINGGDEKYISLPEKEISIDQKYSLIDWLDQFILQGEEFIKISSYNGQQKTYYFNGDEYQNIAPYTGSSIVNKIMKYYNSGKLEEDTIKIKNGKWTNKGKNGSHGNFRTKKQANEQRKAMFANGYKK